jgi:hypothetical protein
LGFFDVTCYFCTTFIDIFGAVGSFFFNTFKKNAYFINSFAKKSAPTAPQKSGTKIDP